MNEQEKPWEKEARERKEREQKEREEKEKAEKEKAEKEKAGKEKSDKEKADKEKKEQQEKAEKEKAEREDKERKEKEDKGKDDYQKSEKEKADKAIKEGMEKESKALKEAHDKESERVKNLSQSQPHGAGKGPHKPEQNHYQEHFARQTGDGMVGYRSDMMSQSQKEAMQRHWQTHAAKHGRDSAERRDDPQADGVKADRGGPDRPGPAPAHAHAGKPWHEKHGGHPDHLGTIMKDKVHGAVEKPWNRQHADPDRSESRMAAQSRQREREDQTR